MGHLITVASCQLDQWALDWEGNCDRIIQSIIQAKSRGASLRVGPELEITGYGLLDHFLESDTFLHSWEMYARILEHPDCQSILLDVGMPVMHKGVRFNCRIISYSKRILLIRPKIWLANDGNYREMRYFTPWLRPRFVEQFALPRIISSITGQQSVPIGDAVISTADTTVGSETCEEMFTPDAPNIAMGLDGVEIFTNSSGSHHELRKLDTRISIITEATRKAGGIYLYANQRGCDGDRLYYDGSCLIIVNGKIVAQGTQFSLNDVEVITATIDLEDVRSYRSTMSRCLQAVANSQQYQRVRVQPETVSLSLPYSEFNENLVPSPEIQPRIHKPEEEVALGPACWLWDYLRRCKSYGFFLALSGGIDSCSTAVIVFSMCRVVLDGIQSGNKQVLKDLNMLVYGSEKVQQQHEEDLWIPTTPQEICYRLFHTTYMGTENSSKETRQRAKDLAKAINAYHVDLNMDIIVKAFISVFSLTTNKEPKFKVHGGSNAENLALQNIQARSRMVLSYLFSQLLPWARNSPRGSGGLLVLASSNVDECLRGYLTKYDCSSADLNPIGSVAKTDLRRFIKWATTEFDLPVLNEFLNATPTAELEPITDTYVQSDEQDMGMTYKQLGQFGKLRKISKCGPYSMFTKLYHKWTAPPLSMTGHQVMEKVLSFFYYYAINRHKQTILTPSYHAEQYSPDDNRYDLRPFLIDPLFSWPRKKILAFLSQSDITQQQ